MMSRKAEWILSTLLEADSAVAAVAGKADVGMRTLRRLPALYSVTRLPNRPRDGKFSRTPLI